MMQRRWPADELEWGRECLLAGDTVDEIAEAAGCSRVEVLANVGMLRLTSRERDVLSLYSAGCSFAAIELTLDGSHSRRPGSRPAATVTVLRRKGLNIPHRNDMA